MLKYIFVITVVLTVNVFAEKNKSGFFPDPEPQCINGTNEKVNSAYDHYSKMLTSYVQKQDQVSLALLKASATNFTKVINEAYNETCAGEKLPSNMNMSFFIDLIEFAIKDGKYSNFINSNGISCVDIVKPDIQKCIRDNLGTPAKPKATVDNVPPLSASGGNITNVTGAHNIHNAGGNSSNMVQGVNGIIGNTNSSVPVLLGTTDNNDQSQKHIAHNLRGLLKKAKLKFNEYACDITRDIRKCVMTAMMNQHNATCTAKHLEFVDSLFAFSLQKCPQPSQVPVKPNGENGANSLLLKPIVILLPLVGAILMK